MGKRIVIVGVDAVDAVGGYFGAYLALALAAQR